MDLIGYVRLLRRRWWIVLLGVLVAVGAAIGASQVQHKRYRTGSKLLVSGSTSVSDIDEITKRSLATQRAVSFAQIAATDPVIVAAEQLADAQTGGNSAAANPSISTSATGKDPFLTVTVSADDPQVAYQLALALPKVLPAQLQKLDVTSGSTPAVLTVLNPPGVPSKAYSPDPVKDGLLGLGIGLVLGIGAALLRESLDTSLRDSAEVGRATDVPVLGIVPREFEGERLPAATRAHSRRSEAYRQLRTNLYFSVDGSAPRTLVVTSAGQGEGKSTTTANLALLASRAGKSVVLVDADLRKPTIADYFNADPAVGLSDVLAGRRAVDDALQPIEGELLTVLPSGPVAKNPSELLGSPAMTALVRELEGRYDLVIIDSPPVIAVTDALLVGAHTDGVLLIVRMNSTTRSALRRSIEAINRVNGRLLGLVVNASTEVEDRRYSYGGYVSEDKSIEGADLRPAPASIVSPSLAAPPEPSVVPVPVSPPSPAEAQVAPTAEPVTAPGALADPARTERVSAARAAAGSARQGGGSSSAVSRLSARARETRQRDAGHDEGQRGVSGRPVDVDHAVQEPVEQDS